MNRVEKVCAIISSISIIVIVTIISLNTSTKIRSKIFINEEQGSTRILSAKTDYFEGSLQKILNSGEGSWSLSVFNISENTRTEINSTKQYHAASLSKLITAATVFQMVEEGEANLDTKTGGKTIRKLLKLMINRSDNDSWHVLNEFATFDRIQKTAQSIGMYHTNVYTNRSSTADISILLEDLHKKRILNNEHTQFLLSLMRNTETEDRIPAGLPDNTVVYHKTGTLDDNIHDAAIIITQKPYILVIMGEGTNREDGSETIRKISSAVYEEMTKAD